MADHKIPGGPNKGQLLAEADDNTIQYWIKRRSAELAGEPEGRFAADNQRWIEAARAEISSRGLGGGPAAAAAPKPAAEERRGPGVSAAIQRRAPADIQSLGQGMNDPAAITHKLQELGASFHLVSPATHVDGLPPGCGVAISYVTVDANDDKEGPGEVYSVGGKKLGLSATTLSKIGAAAGISWDPRHSRRLDNGKDPLYCHYIAVGITKNFDGSPRVLTGTVEIDARDGSPQIIEIRTKAEARRKENPTWKNDGGDSQILELRKFLLRHAERKAKSRAIADLGVKRSYTAAELDKPFAVARIMFTGQTDDPELRKVLALRTADAMLGGGTALFGPVPPPPPSHDGHEPPPIGRSQHEASGEEAPDWEREERDDEPSGEPRRAAGY